MPKRKVAKKKALKKTERRSTARDQYTVVLEDIHSQFQAFGEGLDVVSNKLDVNTEQLGEIKQQLTKVEIRLTKVEIRLKEVEVRLAEVEKQSVAMKIELEFVKEQLSVVRHNQITRDEFKLLETRVARLEHSRGR